MATGNEILSYRPDADLAAGSSTGIDIGLEGNAPQQTGAAVGSIMKDAFNHQLAWGSMKYQQAVKDRDDIYQTFAEQDLNFPVLDEDQPALQQKIDSIKEKLIATPDIKSNREAFMEVQKEIKALTAEKAVAKTRAAMAAQLRTDAAKETNPLKKKKMLDHLQKELGKGASHIIEPYSELVAWNDKTLPPPATITTYEYGLDKNGLPTKTAITTTDPNFYTNHLSFEGVLTGDKQNLPFELKDFYEQQINNPDIMNKEFFDRINAKVDAYNIANGLNPESKNWVRHVGSVEEDGSVRPATKPVDFAKAIWVADTYQSTRGTPVYDEERHKGFKTKAEIGKMGAEAKAATMNAGSNRIRAVADAENSRAQAEKARAEGDVKKYELLMEQASVAQEVKDSYHIFSTAAKDNKGYVPVTQIIKPSDTVSTQELERQLPGITTGGWTVKDLGRGSMAERRALASLGTFTYGGTEGTGVPGEAKPDTKVVNKVVYPAKVLMVKSPDGDLDKMRLVGLDKSGKVVATADMNEAGLNMLRETSNFNADAAFQKKSAAYSRAWSTAKATNIDNYPSLSALEGNQPAAPVAIAPMPKEKLSELPSLGEGGPRTDGDIGYDPNTGDPVIKKVNGVWQNIE